MREFTQNGEVNVEFKGCRKTKNALAVVMNEAFKVHTKEGIMHGKPGDLLMKGVAGELYPCDAQIFADSYEWVE